MEDNKEVVEDQPEEPEVQLKPNEMFVSLMRENHTLKTWVVGLVSGCEGCAADAASYVELMGLQHEG